MTPDQKISSNLESVARGLYGTLHAIAGEKMGFALFVCPSGRAGDLSYVSNLKREDMAAKMLELLGRWDRGESCEPCHIREAKK